MKRHVLQEYFFSTEQIEIYIRGLKDDDAAIPTIILILRKFNVANKPLVILSFNIKFH